MSNAVTITEANFETEVGLREGKVLLDFWASWCGPCQMLGPVIEQVADDLDGKVLVGKVNVDDNRELASRFGVMTIPTLVVFKDGVEVNRVVGVQSKANLIKMVEQA